jgi:hypothetical protein
MQRIDKAPRKQIKNNVHSDYFVYQSSILLLLMCMVAAHSCASQAEEHL